MLDITIWGAFMAGVVSFLTPCVLPIVPFYLAYLAGASMSEMKSEGADGAQARNKAIRNASAFVLGLVTIFTLMGLSSSFLGQFLQQNIKYFRWIAGGAMIVLGLNFMGVIHIGFLSQEARLSGPKSVGGFFSAYIVGVAFAFGWTACVGPILASILMLAAQQDNVMQGTIMLLSYGLGMGLPFLIAALFYGYFLQFYGSFRKYLPVLEKVVGALLIIFGILLLTNGTRFIADWLINKFPGFMNIL